MADELPDVPALRMHEPPPGGLERLRERLELRRRRWLLVVVPAVALALLALVLFVRRSSSVAPASPVTASVPALRDRGVAADGTFYWVASTPGTRIARTQTISIDEVRVVADYPSQ